MKDFMQFYVGAMCMALVWVSVNIAFPDPKPEHLVMAYKQGRKDALGKMSWDLERTCAALWISSLPLPPDAPEL